jgi:hypothetical protein
MQRVDEVMDFWSVPRFDLSLDDGFPHEPQTYNRYHSAANRSMSATSYFSVTTGK